MIDPSDVGVVLLAAGRSTRFVDGDKLVADFAGGPLAGHVAHVLAALRPRSLIAVCGPDADAIRAVLAPLGFSIVQNAEPGRGLSSSLAIGIAAVSDCPAALVCLADMPLVTHAHLRRMLASFDAAGAPVVASTSEGVASPPALIARSLYPGLMALNGDRGARDLIAGGVLVDAAPNELRDIDTIADLARFTPFAAGDPDICPA